MTHGEHGESGPRERAEEALERTPHSRQDSAAPVPQGYEQALHELRVHQLELQAQNEELRRMQAELEAARAHYTDLYDHAPVGYCTISEQGRVLESNQTAAAMLGLARGALLRRHFARFVLREDQDAFYLHTRQLLESGEPSVCELRMVKADAATLWARLETGAPANTAGVRSFRIALSDITEQRALLESLARTNRIASMGILAAGMAHEIKNPLTFVLLNAQLLAEELPALAAALRGRAGDGGVPLDPLALEKLADRATKVVTGSQRISEITRSLGHFSRQERSELSPLDLNAVIEEALEMTANEIAARALLVRELAQVPAVMAVTSRLAQVFVNLLVNAAHSITEGAVEDNRITVRTWNEAGTVFAEVRDTGCGIPQPHVASVFEPFFTTKGPEGGTGLGLSVARNVVCELGGDIALESVGNGTRVVVSLPSATAAAENPAPATARSLGAAPVARGRVLVVDDEELVCSVVQAILADQHEVVTCGSGREARKLLTDDARFDLVLCDLMMPDGSGIELHAWLAENRPDLARRLAFITGGVFTPRAREYLEGLPNSVLEKPLDVDLLRELAEECVRRPAT